MIFFICFMGLLLASLIQIVTKKKYTVLLVCFTVILYLLNALRYGIGQDYFNYLYIYNKIPQITDIYFFQNELHGEIGYQISVGISNFFGIDYIVYSFILSTIIFILLYKFLKEQCVFPFASLTILYVMYYFSYFNSGVRQALTLIVFLAILIPKLLNNKNKEYFILVIILSLFHKSILICLFFIFIKINWKSKNMFYIGIFSFLAMIISILLKDNILIILLRSLGITFYYEATSISFFAIFSRLSMGMIVIFLGYLNRKTLSIDQNRLLSIYMIGMFAYFLLATEPLMASRLHVYFKILEVILVPSLLYKLNLKNRIILSIPIFFILMPVFYVKEINGQINQGQFIGVNNFYEYPYVSVFNKEKIYRYRIIPKHIVPYL